VEGLCFCELKEKLNKDKKAAGEKSAGLSIQKGLPPALQTEQLAAPHWPEAPAVLQEVPPHSPGKRPAREPPAHVAYDDSLVQLLAAQMEREASEKQQGRRGSSQKGVLEDR